MKKLIALAVVMSASHTSFASEWLESNHLPHYLSYPERLDSVDAKQDQVTRTVSALHVNLNNWIEEQDLYRTKPNTVHIFADTIEISQNFNLLVNNQNIIIFARKIIGRGSPNIVLGKEGAVSSITIIAQDIETPFSVSAHQADGSIKYERVDLKNTSGTSILLAGKNYRKVDLTKNYASSLQLGKDSFSGVINRSFDMAASIYDQEPETSLKMLNWLEESMRKSGNTVANDPVLEDLYLQTLAFQSFAQQSSRKNNFVPYLDRSLYQNKFAAYLDTMMAFEEKRERVTQTHNSIQDKIQNARLAGDNIKDVLKTQNIIIEQSEQNVTKLLAGIRDIKAQYNAQELIALSAGTKYRTGVDKWQRDQKVKAGLAVFKALVELGGAISGVFTGNLSAANDLQEQLTKEVPEALDRAKNLVTNIKNITDVIEKVSKTVDGINNLGGEIKTASKLNKLFKKVEEFKFNTPSLNESNLAWDKMLIEVKSNLRYAHEKEIKGAREYLIELEKQILLGKAINAAQLNLIQKQAELVDLILTRKVTIRQSERLNSYIDEAGKDEKAQQLMEQELYRMSVHFKRPMFVALSNYVAAYNYWSLSSNSRVKPSLNKPYYEYQEDLATIASDYNDALNNFRPGPQPFNVTDIIIKDKEQLNALVTEGKFNFNIPLEQKQFCSLDRVRLDSIRIYLLGKELPQGKTFNLEISNSGSYQDRHRQNKFNFSAEPMKRSFIYVLDDPKSNAVREVLDGKLAEQYGLKYFEPTPFSDWSVRVKNFKTSNNDYLKYIESLRIEFKGKAIPNSAICANQ